MQHLPQKAIQALKDRGHTGSFKLSGSKLYFDNGKIFLFKSASRSSAEQLIGEAKSLADMSTALPGICPELIDTSDQDDATFYMITEWHDLGSLSTEQIKRFGKDLARMHLESNETNGRFGYDIPTYCGHTRFKNQWNKSWIDFLNNDRFGYLLEEICGSNGRGDKELWQLGQTLRNKTVPALLSKVDVKPSLLQGDLWAGNASYSHTTKRPITYDACCFYGHNEAELGIAVMFGGFGSPFFEAYHSVYPKAEPVEEYGQRLKLYELIHHLNHYAIFGGMYRNGAVSIMKSLNKYVESKEN
ncbi:Ketosamine-3-kinase [Wallemia mellicola]|nr:Ketosamine-3-kinase [Wallemia mellicola]